MGKLVISDALLIGHPTIDEEHRQLASLVNDSAIALATGDKTKCARTVEKIVEDLDRHFQSEEGIMSQLGYEATESHCHCHEKCLNQLTNVFARCHPERCPGKKCLMWVTSIIIDDLIGADMGFKGHLQEIDYRG